MQHGFVLAILFSSLSSSNDNSLEINLPFIYGPLTFDLTSFESQREEM